MWNKLNKNKTREPARPARQFTPRLELLEDRLAPASALDFTDVDGDRVLVTSTRGDLKAKLATFAATGAGVQLQALDLTGSDFQGAAIATRVTRVPGGDGLVNIGHIYATGRDLSSVVVKGDLGAIDAGDGDPATPALGLLTVRSMGRYGLATQDPFTASLVSNLTGALRTLRVAGDIREASVEVIDPVGTAGRIGSVVIGGSLVGGSDNQSGSVFAEDGIGLVTIRGDIVGGVGQTSGSVRSTGEIAGVTVGGSVLGGPGFSSGVIFSSEGAVGLVRVSRDVVGGTDAYTGRVFGKIGIASVTVGGSLLGGTYLGGTANDSGRIHSDGAIGPVRIGRDIRGGIAPATGCIQAADLGPVWIGGDLRGGGDSSGQIVSTGSLAALTIGGSVVGGRGAYSAEISVTGAIGPVRIGRDLVGGVSSVFGGAISDSGRISGGAIAALTIGGSVIGNMGHSTGTVISFGDIGPVFIGQDVVGGFSALSGGFSGYISASKRIASLTVRGSVLGGDVSAGGPMGPVRIGGDLAGGIGSNENMASVSIRGSVGSNRYSGGLASSGNMGAVSVGRDLFGWIIARNLAPLAEGKLASLTVGGSVLGGSVSADGPMGPVRIGGDLRGGSIAGTQGNQDKSGYIEGARIASVFVGGSVVSGTNTSTAGVLTRNASIRAASDLGPVVVKGSLVGNPTCPVIISALGQSLITSRPTQDLAIRSLTVGGRVEFAQVLAGFNTNLTPENGNASVGAVSVGGDWIASSIAAGVRDTNGDGFGNDDDTLINNAGDAIVAQIASVTIGGVVAGTAADRDHFGFVAEQIGSFRVGGVAVGLTDNPEVIELSPTTGDVTVREV